MHIEPKTAAEASMQLMIEHAPVGMALFEAHEFRLLAANNRYRSSLGPEWQHRPVIEHRLVELLPQALQAEVVARFQKVVETGKADRAEAYAFPASSGDIQYWNWLLDPISEQGQVAYVLLTTVEVTADVRARQSADEQLRLHAVLDQLPEGIVLVEARTGKVRYANPAAARLLGFTLPHLVGSSLNQSALRSPYGLSGRYQQSVFRWNFALINALWGKTVTNQEIAIVRPDRSEIVVLSSVAPIRTSNGLITEAVMVFQDITALKQLERQKNAFFAVMNHELRTPLTVIQGFAELLEMSDTENLDSLSRYAVTHIRQECEHLTRLIHDLLDVSRLEYARLDMQRKHQELLEPLIQIIGRHSKTITTHRVRLTLEDLTPTDRLMGRFDLLRIEQILNNLISNATKYSPIGSDIEVGVRPRPDAQGRAQEVLIWVKDQGSGIAAEDQPHIFERFYRAPTLDVSISGFGVGLYLTRELVRVHGGHIWVESTSGQGSTFFVTLPLDDLHQASSAEDTR